MLEPLTVKRPPFRQRSNNAKAQPDKFTEFGFTRQLNAADVEDGFSDSKVR
jgi:hypothetical protein